MTGLIAITRAGPLVSVQDEGRLGMLAHGVSASGPVDRTAYRAAGALAGTSARTAIELGVMGCDFTYSGPECAVGFAGGGFLATINGASVHWPGSAVLRDGDAVEIRTGPWGNWGYLRLAAEIDVPEIMGSRSTNLTVALGGLEGRALAKGDRLPLTDPLDTHAPIAVPGRDPDAPIRFTWGLHAEHFAAEVRAAFCVSGFEVTSQMNRMGVRLKDPDGVFRDQTILSLVSDAVVPGDIQILGDGTPIVLLRDHQPTGGYPRMGTVIDADCDRFAQLRPGTRIKFQPVTLDAAQKELLASR